MKRTFTLCMLLCFWISLSWGQNHQKTEWLRYEKEQKIKPNDVIDSYIKKGAISKKENLELVNHKIDKDQNEHHYFQQIHKGVPIEGAYLNCHSIRGKVFASSSTLKDISIFPSEKAALSEKEALKKALAEIDADAYAWEDKKYVEMLRDMKKDPEYSIYPTGELLFSKNKKDGSFELVYKFEVHSQTPKGRFIIHVNAKNGTILSNIDIIHHVCDNPTTSTVNTLFHGSQTIDTDNNINTNEHVLGDCNRGISTFILPDNSTTLSSATIAEDDNVNFSNFNSIKQKAALTAHWATEVTYDFFFDTFGDEGYSDEPDQIQAIVNYGSGTSGTGSRNNAFWDGSHLVFGAGPMQGDNSSTSFLSTVVSSDIVAHEYGHAVTEFSTPYDLQYQGESGAINEAFSDIIAAAVDRHLILQANAAVNNSDTPGITEIDPWLIGETISAKNCNNTFVPGLRNMADPYINCHPKQYEGINWVNTTTGGDYGGVHSNSSIMNYWFYILTTGSQSGQVVDEQGVSYTFDPIPFDDAFAIVYKSYDFVTEYHISFLDMREYTINANECLNIGQTFKCDYTASIEKAWNAVHVGSGNSIGVCNNAHAAINYDITQLCTTAPNGGTYNFYADLPQAGFTYTWNVSEVGNPTNTTTFSSQDLSLSSFTNAGEYIIELLVAENGTNNIEQDEILVYVIDCQDINDTKGVMYFGEYHGFDFRNGAVEYVNYNHINYESNICQTDADGDLLFYLAANSTDVDAPMNLYDGQGNFIYELNNPSFVNPTPIWHSSSQIGAAIPRPDGNGYKLIMDSGNHTTTENNGLYSLDIINTNGVISVNSDIMIIPPPPSSNYQEDINGALRIRENTVVIPGCSNTEFWILATHDIQDDIIAYKLIFDGTYPNGYIDYNSIVINNMNNNRPNAKFVVNKEGDILVGGNKQYTFDRQTGQLTYIQDFNSLALDFIVSSGAFSPDGNYYYASDRFGKIYQYDTNGFTNESIIDNNDYPDNTQIDFVLGPDDKIYTSRINPSGPTNFSVINYPNNSNIFGEVGYNQRFIPSIEGYVRNIFPKYIEATIPEPQVTVINVNQTACTSIEASTDVCTTGNSWDFGDGSPIVPYDPTTGAYTHTYTNTGTYTVQLLNSLGNPVTSENITITGWNTPGLSIYGNDHFCDEPEQYLAPSYYTYEWSIDGDATLSSTSNQTTTVLYGSLPNYTLSLVLTDELGCTETLTMSVNQDCGTPSCPVDFHIYETQDCATFQVEGAECLTSYSWDFGDGTVVEGEIGASHTYTDAGTYTITLTTNTNGTLETLEQTVTISEECLDPCINTTHYNEGLEFPLVWNSNNGYPTYINEDIIVPSYTSLEIIGATIEFGDQGRIIVQHGAQLNVVNSRLLYADQCGGDGWKGILIQGKGNVKIVEKSLIQGAITGVYGINVDQDVLTANNSTFRDNGTCIYFRDCSNLIFDIKDCLFETTDPDPASFPFALVRINNVLLNPNHFVEDVLGFDNNTFRNAVNGIYTTNLTGGKLNIGHGNQFNDLDFGIKLVYGEYNDLINSSKLDIHGNFFNDNNKISIHTNRVSKARISGNTIRGNQQLGIQMRNAYNFDITDNYIEGLLDSTSDPISSDWSAGIRLFDNDFNDSSLEQNVTGNHFKNLKTGLAFKKYKVNNHGITVDCNTFEHLYNGITAYLYNELGDFGSFAAPLSNAFIDIATNDLVVGDIPFGDYYHPDCTGCGLFEPTIFYPSSNLDHTIPSTEPSTCDIACSPTEIDINDYLYLNTNDIYIWSNLEDLFINQEIVIPSNSGFIIDNSTIEFGPQGSIVMGDQSAIEIINSTLTRTDNCVTDKWQGIKMEGQSTIYVYANSVIEHAEVAISGNGNSLGYNPLAVRIENATFNNNTTSLSLSNDVGTFFNDIDFHIENSVFTSDSYNSVESHISLENLSLVQDTNIGDYQITNTLFENAKRAIGATSIIGGSLNIGGAETASANEFVSCLRTIVVNNSSSLINPNSFAGVLIDNNIFTNTAYALDFDRVFNIDVLYNEFTGISNIGIDLRNSRFFNVTGNNIDGEYINGGNSSRGILLNISTNANADPGGDKNIYRNVITKFKNGLEFNNYTDNNHVVSITCNKFIENNRGILVTNSSIISSLTTEDNYNMNSFYLDPALNDSDGISVTQTSELQDYHYPDCLGTSCDEFQPSIGGNGIYPANPMIITEVMPDCSSQRLVNTELAESKVNTQISPNPNNGQFIIELSGDIKTLEKAIIHIYDVQGQKIQSINYEEMENGSSSVDLSGFASGMYLVQVQTANELITKKVMVAK